MPPNGKKLSRFKQACAAPKIRLDGSSPTSASGLIYYVSHSSFSSCPKASVDLIKITHPKVRLGSLSPESCLASPYRASRRTLSLRNNCHFSKRRDAIRQWRMSAEERGKCSSPKHRLDDAQRRSRRRNSSRRDSVVVGPQLLERAH